MFQCLISHHSFLSRTNNSVLKSTGVKKEKTKTSSRHISVPTTACLGGWEQRLSKDELFRTMPPTMESYSQVSSRHHLSSIIVNCEIISQQKQQTIENGGNVNLWIIHCNVTWEQEILLDRHQTHQMHIFRWSWKLLLCNTNKAVKRLVRGRETKQTKSTIVHRRNSAVKQKTQLMHRLILTLLV